MIRRVIIFCMSYLLFFNYTNLLCLFVWFCLFCFIRLVNIMSCVFIILAWIVFWGAILFIVSLLVFIIFIIQYLLRNIILFFKWTWSAFMSIWHVQQLRIKWFRRYYNRVLYLVEHKHVSKLGLLLKFLDKAITFWWGVYKSWFGSSDHSTRPEPIMSGFGWELLALLIFWIIILLGLYFLFFFIYTIKSFHRFPLNLQDLPFMLLLALKHTYKFLSAMAHQINLSFQALYVRIVFGIRLFISRLVIPAVKYYIEALKLDVIVLKLKQLLEAFGNKIRPVLIKVKKIIKRIILSNETIFVIYVELYLKWLWLKGRPWLLISIGFFIGCFMYFIALYIFT